MLYMHSLVARILYVFKYILFLCYNLSNLFIVHLFLFRIVVIAGVITHL